MITVSHVIEIHGTFFIFITRYPTSWAYTENRQLYQFIIPELVGFTDTRRRGLPNTSPEDKLPTTRNLHRLLLFGE